MRRLMAWVHRVGMVVVQRFTIIGLPGALIHGYFLQASLVLGLMLL